MACEARGARMRGGGSFTTARRAAPLVPGTADFLSAGIAGSWHHRRAHRGSRRWRTDLHAPRRVGSVSVLRAAPRDVRGLRGRPSPLVRADSASRVSACHVDATAGGGHRVGHRGIGKLRGSARRERRADGAPQQRTSRELRGPTAAPADSVAAACAGCAQVCVHVAISRAADVRLASDVRSRGAAAGVSAWSRGAEPDFPQGGVFTPDLRRGRAAAIYFAPSSCSRPLHRAKYVPTPPPLRRASTSIHDTLVCMALTPRAAPSQCAAAPSGPKVADASPLSFALRRLGACALSSDQA